jgi:hypothetical protein
MQFGFPPEIANFSVCTNEAVSLNFILQVAYQVMTRDLTPV